jgi:hypothetical protein
MEMGARERPPREKLGALNQRPLRHPNFYRRDFEEVGQLRQGGAYAAIGEYFNVGTTKGACHLKPESKFWRNKNAAKATVMGTSP